MAWGKDSPSSARRVARLARLAMVALITTVVASAGVSEALPQLSGSASAAALPIVVVPCAPATPGPRVLLAQRVLLQTWSSGRTQGPTVPAFAGQWGPFFGSPSASGASVQSAVRLFAAQTAQPLPSATKATVQADQSDFAVTEYVIVRMSAAALDQLAAAAAQAIAARTPPQGVLSTVEAMSLPEAVDRLGPAPPPPDGWEAFVIEQAFGGQQPGPLDTEVPTLTAMLTYRTVQTSDTFQQALLLAGRVCASAPAQP
jgi:hypothetical protein